MNGKGYRFQGKDIPTEEDLLNCLHCGLCLPTCPTFALTGMEKYSPRGRIQLMKYIADGELSISDDFADTISLCLGCQACETACPAGVPYGRMLSAARQQIEENLPSSPIKRFLRWYFFKRIFPSKKRFVRLAFLVRLLQKLKLDKIPGNRYLTWLFPQFIRDMAEMAPGLSGRFGDKYLSKINPPTGETKYRIGFTPGCFMNVMFGQECDDLVRVLNLNACEVVVPLNHPCCGSVNGHNGDLDGARRLARLTIDAFEALNVDYIVMNSAGCSAFMKEYPDLLRDDPVYFPKASKIAEKTMDFSEFLCTIDFKIPDHPIRLRATYDDPCHLIHGHQHLRSEPRKIIKSIPGLAFIELPESDWCCGSAGIYNIVEHDSSMKILKRKMDHLKSTGADILLSGNPGCLAQLRYGVQKWDIPIRVMHPVSLLRMSYDGIGLAEKQ